jgi:hypothetical protein
MIECKEHRRELISDPDGRQHPVCSPGREDQFWVRVISYQVYQAHLKLEVFANLKSQSEGLRDLQNAHPGVPHTGSDFPEGCTDGLLQFRFHLHKAAQSIINQLGHMWNASPPVRTYYRRKVETDAASEVEELRVHFSFHDDPTRVRIYWLLERLFMEDDLFELLDFTHIVVELQRLVAGEAAKQCISPYIASLVEELALVGALLRQLELYQPWVDMHGHVSSMHLAILTLIYATSSLTNLVLALWHDKQDPVVGSLGTPTGGKFVYPVGKRRTRETVEAMRSAEENLDKFWRKVDEDIKSKADSFWDKTAKRFSLPTFSIEDYEAGPRASGAVRRLLTQGRTLQRTPAWTEPEPGNSQAPVAELYVPFSRLSFDDHETDDQTLRESASQPGKEKIKTRKPGDPKVISLKSRGSQSGR